MLTEHSLKVAKKGREITSSEVALLVSEPDMAHMEIALSLLWTIS